VITAEALKQLTTLRPYALSRLLAISGYKGASFKSAEFVGITNGGEFAYKVVYFDEAGTGEDEVGKVFVKYDPTTNKVSADY
jgi:hypothetical protein